LPSSWVKTLSYFQDLLEKINRKKELVCETGAAVAKPGQN